MGSVRPGDVLAGKYRVERVLGQGGMGYVIAARHLQLDQLVAIKLVKQGALDSDEATARFLREAKAVARLKNEHVARVFDVGTLESGEPYMVMEYLEGCDLSALSKQRGSVPIGEAVEYVVQACEALAEAHGLGIVHRDVKLANLFVTTGPAGAPLVKVLDFGISKTNPFGESEHDVTRTASMLGSPRFMSPEQMRDPRAVDARTDVWSLGVVLYRLVVGRAPFEADTLGRLLTMVMHEQHLPPSSARAGLPPGLDAVLARCLAKEPAHRFASVAELAMALAPFAIEPARARAAAERMAAVLGLAQIPITLDLPPAPSGRASGPPGSLDTGTASPWAGTHAGTGASPPPSRAGVFIAAGALCAILVAGGVFAKVRHDRATAAAAAAAAPTAQETVQVTPPPPPPATVPAPRVIGESTPPAAAPTTEASAEPATSAPVRAPSRPAEPRRDEGVAKRRAPVVHAKPAPHPAAPPKSDDGIPATRD